MLKWTHSLTEIGAESLAADRDATSAERASVAAELGLPEVAQLHAQYAIRALASGRYRLSGELSAEVTQVCVVTLEQVSAKVDELFDVEFWPPDALPGAAGGEIDVLAAADIEPIEGERIDVGRVVFETLAAGLDPYPRAPGAVFEAREPLSQEEPASGPFAALAKLKKGSSPD